MPIVVSYTDLQALGTLATQAGRAQGQAQAAARDQQASLQQQQIDARERAGMRSAAVDRYGIDTRQNTALAQMQAQQMQQERRLAGEMQQLAMRGQQGVMEQTRDQAFRAEQAEREQEARRTRELEINQLRQDAAYERAELSAQARVATAGRSGGAAAPSYRLGGGQDPKFATEEAQRFAHLLPVSTNRAAMTMAATGERAQEAAQQLSTLPTNQLMAWAETNASDPYFPYVQAVIADRQRQEARIRAGARTGRTGIGAAPGNVSLMDGAAGGSTGNPYGGGAPPVTRRGAAPMAPTGFEGISTEELYQQLNLSPGMTADEILDSLTRNP